MSEEEVNITIKDIAYGGNGVGELADGRICFVPFVAIGEEVSVKIIKEKKKFVEAQLVAIIKKSPSRVEPQCPHFTHCGGCDYQHLSYEEQLKIKSNQLQHTLKRIGGIETPKISIIASEQQYNYPCARTKFPPSKPFRR